MEDYIDNVHREPSGEKNMRFLGYKFLQDVKFLGEPVVPKILSEGKDEQGDFFEVEKLNGIDFLTFPIS